MPQIVANPPEVRDDQEFFDGFGPVCATAACRSGMRKLSDALCERSLPAIAAVAAEPAVVEAEEADPQPVVPPAAVLDGDAVEADPYNAEARLADLHSASRKRCTCALCQAAKQRRDFAESLSHSHNEQACQQTPGLHSFNNLPTYVGTIDYGNNQFCNGNARYDLFGVSPATKTLVVVPSPNKQEDTIASALKSARGPNEDTSKFIIRSDNANELTSAIEQTSFSDPLTPHRRNSNKAERSIFVYSDLLRVWFLIWISALLQAAFVDRSCEALEPFLKWFGVLMQIHMRYLGRLTN